MDRWAVLACAALCLHCSSESDDGPDCTGYAPQATAAEIALTPRENGFAEILALEASSTLVAPEDLYVRVAGELDVIFSAEPVTRMCKPRSEVPIDDVRVDFTEAGWKKVVAGDYHAWDCANAAYGGTPALNSQWHFATLSFGDKVYRGELLEQEYEALPEASAMRDTYFLDDRDACLEVHGDEHFYIFDDATGDCPSGCMYHHYIGYQASPGSAPTRLGSFDRDQDPEPEWFTKLTDCRSRL